MLVQNDAGKEVYAYGGSEMEKLFPNESNEALTTEISMKTISNAEYVAIDDINITITEYDIDTENTSSDVESAWNE